MTKKKIGKNRKQKELHRQDARKRDREIALLREEKIQTLKEMGIDLPFYELVDSFEAKFMETIEEAQKRLPMLHEVLVHPRSNVREFDWRTRLGPGWTALGVEIPEAYKDYGRRDGKRYHVEGYCTFFLDPNQELKATILIPYPPSTQFYGDQRFGFMLIALYHEIGHVIDASRNGFLSPLEKRFELVEAEAFANCYALDQLADQCMRIHYNYFYDGFASSINNNGYFSDVSRRVLELHSRRTVRSWSEESAAKRDEIANEEIEALLREIKSESME